MQYHVHSRKYLINGRNGTQWIPGTRTHYPLAGDSSPAGGSRTHRKQSHSHCCCAPIARLLVARYQVTCWGARGPRGDATGGAVWPTAAPTPASWPGSKFETCPRRGAKSQNSRRDPNSHPHVHRWLTVTAEGGATSRNLGSTSPRPGKTSRRVGQAISQSVSRRDNRPGLPSPGS